MADRHNQDRRFRKSERLKEEKDFKRLFTRGFRLRGRLMMLACIRSEGERSRAGIVAGKRVGNAVARSRAKRLLREAYRLEKHRLTTPCDLAFVASPNINRAALKDVQAEAARLLEDAVERLDDERNSR